MIFAVGEVLIDFIAVEDALLKDVKTFEKHAGGAPANVVVGLRRLNVPSALISKVGRDPLGEFLIERLRAEGVDTSYIAYDEERGTGVVFVQLRKAKPEFILYDQVAYFNLRLEDIDLSFMEKADLIHFGGVFLAREPSKTTNLKLMELAKGRVPISYDANIRLHLWRGRVEAMVKDMTEAMKLADILKIGDEEKKFLEDHGVDFEGFDIKLLTITKGAEGSELICGGAKAEAPAYKVQPVDTTGAGDAYVAAIIASLYALEKLDRIDLDEDELKLIGRFANIVAALTTIKRGAWTVPRAHELARFHELKPIVERLTKINIDRA